MNQGDGLMDRTMHTQMVSVAAKDGRGGAWSAALEHLSRYGRVRPSRSNGSP